MAEQEVEQKVVLWRQGAGMENGMSSGASNLKITFKKAGETRGQKVTEATLWYRVRSQRMSTAESFAELLPKKLPQFRTDPLDLSRCFSARDLPSANSLTVLHLQLTESF